MSKAKEKPIPNPVKSLKDSTLGCPACRDIITTQKQILAYREVYLRKCKYHHELWTAADLKYKDYE